MQVPDALLYFRNCGGVLLRQTIVTAEPTSFKVCVTFIFRFSFLNIQFYVQYIWKR